MWGTGAILTWLGFFLNKKFNKKGSFKQATSKCRSIQQLQLDEANYAITTYKGFTQFSKTVGSFDVYPSRALNDNLKCNQLSKTYMRTP